jgi:hypothetical protein
MGERRVNMMIKWIVGKQFANLCSGMEALMTLLNLLEPSSFLTNHQV